ncbi:class I SAM-dependent methyltransferase [Miltoncostaea marina]|uniref:class I SAM-dependent methyltransferase n=1 Tax=Miltoncostaea marina TaxID=2843215 RepID=UPI001C3E7478|nr:class I SAM-dependent methyltransferase [Miltoncostaea marina]
MSTTPAAPAVDLAAVKRRQRTVWASGDYAAIATLIVPISERLADAADLRAGSRVLDVATGSGNAAIAAARMGCEVTGVDYVPALLERGRERAAAERLAITFTEGDVEDLPVADASYDAVTSVVGAMFAPDQRRAAAEMARVVRPGGCVALASWTPEGFLGDMFRTMAAHVPPPAGVASPLMWGSEDHVASLFGDAVRWRHRRRHFTFRFASPERYVEMFATTYGPTLAAMESLDEEGRAGLAHDLAALARRHDRLGGGGAIAIPAEYLESVGLRR